MRYLRTNTAVIITVGPFLDKTDGVTPETGLTATNEHITLMADTDAGSAPTLVLDITGAGSGTNNDFVHITGDDAGFYSLEIAAADVNRLGRAMLAITDAANHCPVFHEFTILPAVVYDSLVLGTDLLQTDETQILGTAISTPATAGILDVNVKNISNATVSTTSAQVGVNVVQLSTDATAADNAESFFDGTGYAGTNNVIPTVTTLTNANPTAASVADAVWDEAATGHTDAGKAGEQLWTDVDAILVDTGTTLDGRIPAALVSGRIDASVGAMAANTLTATAIATGAVDADALAADVINDIWAGTALTEAYAADGVAATPAELLYMIWARLAQFAITSTTISVKKLDGTTEAFTLEMDSATTPTTSTRAT